MNLFYNNFFSLKKSFYNNFITYKFNLNTYIDFVVLYRFYLTIINIFIYNFGANICALYSPTKLYYIRLQLFIIPFSLIKYILKYFNINVIYEIKNTYLTTDTSDQIIIPPIISCEIIHVSSEDNILHSINNSIYKNKLYRIINDTTNLNKNIIVKKDITSELHNYNNYVPIIFIMNTYLKNSNIIKLTYLLKGQFVNKYFYINNNIICNINKFFITEVSIFNDTNRLTLGDLILYKI
jgi:hypothetical protein